MGNSPVERVAMSGMKEQRILNSKRRTANGCCYRAVQHSMFDQIRWRSMLAILAIVIIALSSSASPTNEQRTLVLVVGAAGEAEYGGQFAASANLWKEAAAKGGLRAIVIGEEKESPENDRARLLGVLTNEITRPDGELWLAFIGHGTYDGRTAKFNLRGPDISGPELRDVLTPIKRSLAIIQCASASGPFLTALSGSNRVIITATKSGDEVNATRLGNFLAQAVGDPVADLDKDGQTSLLEAYLLASRQVEQFYKEAGRLATEHAWLDDNGDGLGTPADWFRGVRATKAAANGKTIDGVRAHQMNLVRSTAEQQLAPDVRARRDELEKKLSDLRQQKAAMPEDEYYQKLELILIETAQVYQAK
jgi:hypothetical protein